MIKLVVSDMDGTLLNHQGEISPGNLEALHKLKNKGIDFAIASGRDYRSVFLIMHRYGIHCDAILGNGAQYVDDAGNLLMSCYMDKSVVKDVVSIFEERHFPYMIFTAQGMYTTQDPSFVRNAFIERSVRLFQHQVSDFDHGGKFEHIPANHLIFIDDLNDFLKKDIDIIKIESFSFTKEQKKEIQSVLKDIPTISYLSSYDDNVEVTDFYAQKGSILEKVIAMKGLKKEEVAVLGDGMNDITMFEKFPYGFAMKNGAKDIQNLAYRVVSDHREDGVKEAIEIILRDLGN